MAVVARCQPPWTVALLTLELTQGGDAGQGHSNDFGLLCDGRWFHRVLKVVPSPGSFEPGKSEASASLSILDPNTGDPVYTARFERNVWLAGSVAPVLWDQTGARTGRSCVLMRQTTRSTPRAPTISSSRPGTCRRSRVCSLRVERGDPCPAVRRPRRERVHLRGRGRQAGCAHHVVFGVLPTTAPDDLTVPLNPALTLQPGTYWVSVQANVSSLGAGNGWLWAYRQDLTGARGVWRNPGGGFGGGSEDGPRSRGTAGDFEFDLRGTSASV